MILAHVIHECEDKLICDLAETYSILYYRKLSPSLVAVLLLGLRDDSRVKMHISGSKATLEQILLAVIADNLNFLSWTKTKDAKKGRYKKKSIVRALMDLDKKDDLQAFESIEEFNTYMKQFEE